MQTRLSMFLRGFRTVSFALVGAALVLFASPFAQAADTHLVLIGGGNRPPEALARFVEWSGGSGARILVVTWSTSSPEEAFHNIQVELLAQHPASVTAAPAAPLDDAAASRFLSQLAESTGVFFTGGDQNLFMNAVEAHTGLGDAIRARYAAGGAFAGTSAGTAVMPSLMFTGEGDFTVIDPTQVGVRPALGLLPGTFVDMHFLRRQRENRLLSLMRTDPSQLGIGIDEDTALCVENGTRARVCGPGKVMMLDGTARPGSLVMDLLEPGECYDLARRVRRPTESR